MEQEDKIDSTNSGIMKQEVPHSPISQFKMQSNKPSCRKHSKKYVYAEDSVNRIEEIELSYDGEVPASDNCEVSNVKPIGL